MIISAKKLLGLPVLTQSGERLGRVADFRMETDSQSILQYEVRRRLISREFYLINRGQVVSLDEEKMIVEDAVLAEKAEAEPPVILSPKTSSGVAPNFMRSSHDS